MAVNDTFVSSQDALANGGDFVVDGSTAGTNAAIITEIGGSGDADVYRETDPAGDLSWAVTVKIDSFSSGGDWHTELNNLVVNSDKGVRLRINNTSGGTQDIYVVGKETD